MLQERKANIFHIFFILLKDLYEYEIQVAPGTIELFPIL